MQVRIYKPAKSAMQSQENKDKWLMEFLPNQSDRYIEPFLHKVASKDMANEIKLAFDNLESAVQFAQAKYYNYEIIKPQLTKLIKKSYASNFK